MFAKKAQSLNFSRGHFSRGLGLRRNAAAVRPCNDNQAVHLVAPRRRKRPVLSCRWNLTPAGQLECSWHDGSVPTGGEEPGISWRGAAPRRLNRAAIAQRLSHRGRKTTQCRQSTRSALTDSARPFSIESVQVRRLV